MFAAEELNRLYINLREAGNSQFTQMSVLTRNKLRSDPQLFSVIEAASIVEPDLVDDEWIGAFASTGTRGVAWPDYTTEQGRATVSWTILNGLADRIISDRAAWMMSPRDLNGSIMEFVEEWIRPLFDYLIAAIQTQTVEDHIVQRYITRLEWFDRDALYDQYQHNTAKGEDHYDHHMRAWLFDQGLDTYSQARGPSGHTDVLTPNQGVVEIKIFTDPAGAKKAAQSGITQAHHYAQDYGKLSAHLVLVNLTERPLHLPTDGTPDSTSPPYLDLAGVRIFLHTARGIRKQSASKMPKSQPIVLTHTDFVVKDD